MITDIEWRDEMHAVTNDVYLGPPHTWLWRKPHYYESGDAVLTSLSRRSGGVTRYVCVVRGAPTEDEKALVVELAALRFKDCIRDH